MAVVFAGPVPESGGEPLPRPVDAKLVYITATVPFGPDEEFVLRELLGLAQLGVKLLVFPRDCGFALFNSKAAALIPYAEATPLISGKVFAAALRTLRRYPFRACKVLWLVLKESRSPAIAAKNLCVLPKALYLADRLRDEPVFHLHAHWGSTTSTIALIITRILGRFTWSMTLHRWDITENNLLSPKVASAEFVRCISQQGRSEVLSLVGSAYERRIEVIHMGADCRASSRFEGLANRSFHIVTAAHFHPKKGHTYAVKAAKWLRDHSSSDFVWTFYGKGPLRAEIEDEIERLNLGDCVKVQAHIENEKLIGEYSSGSVDLVVLPSVVTGNGEYEGIPVSLMEAMACGIPVVATETGAIRELIRPGCGVLVEQRNSLSLATAIADLMRDAEKRRRLAAAGRAIVARDFNQELISQHLLSKFESGYALQGASKWD